METFEVTLYAADQSLLGFKEFEEALNHNLLRFSLRHIALTGVISQENMPEALRKSILVCKLAGINSRLHFRKMFVVDPKAGIVHIDWLMSRKGFNLMMMQSPTLNEPMARWVWELVN